VTRAATSASINIHRATSTKLLKRQEVIIQRPEDGLPMGNLTDTSWHAVLPMTGTDPTILRKTLTINIETS
jgi:hypothetical protein